MSVAARRRRNDTARLAVAVVLNWMLAAAVAWVIWKNGGSTAAVLQAMIIFAPIAMVSSVGLWLARAREIHTSALVAISYACVAAPLFWVVVIVGAGPG